jgi:hypothetical protein
MLAQSRLARSQPAINTVGKDSPQSKTGQGFVRRHVANGKGSRRAISQQPGQLEDDLEEDDID